MANEIDKSDIREGRIVPPRVLQFILQKSLCAGTDPNPWIRERREAEKSLQELSQGQLVLLTNGYSGHDQRHLMVHTACERAFWASVDEVQKIGASSICPYCNIADDLTRIGTMEQVQHYVIAASESCAYFYAGNCLGSPEDEYDFFCLVHKKHARKNRKTILIEFDAIDEFLRNFIVDLAADKEDVARMADEVMRDIQPTRRKAAKQRSSHGRQCT